MNDYLPWILEKYGPIINVEGLAEILKTTIDDIKLKIEKKLFPIPVGIYIEKGKYLADARDVSIYLCPPKQAEIKKRIGWHEKRRLIFERDKYTCRYCGQKNETLECDHVVPKSRGGSNDIDNLVTACWSCNRSKSNKLLEEWLSPLESFG